jgi:hypothetical protein
MPVRTRIAILSLALLLAPLAAWAAAEPAVYGSITTFAGTGKHPGSTISGLIIDRRTSGLKVICYNYTISTNAKIRGQVSGRVERISDAGVEELGTFGKTDILDFSDLPFPPTDSSDPCAPEVPEGLINFNFGIVTDCLETTTQLEPDDIIRWTFNFKKGAKLKGRTAVISVFGTVLPAEAFGGSARDLGRVRREAAAMIERLPAIR